MVAWLRRGRGSRRECTNHPSTRVDGDLSTMTRAEHNDLDWMLKSGDETRQTDRRAGRKAGREVSRRADHPTQHPQPARTESHKGGSLLESLTGVARPHSAQHLACRIFPKPTKPGRRYHRFFASRNHQPHLTTTRQQQHHHRHHPGTRISLFSRENCISIAALCSHLSRDKGSLLLLSARSQCTARS